MIPWGLFVVIGVVIVICVVDWYETRKSRLRRERQMETERLHIASLFAAQDMARGRRWPEESSTDEYPDLSHLPAQAKFDTAVMSHRAGVPPRPTYGYRNQPRQSRWQAPESAPEPSSADQDDRFAASLAAGYVTNDPLLGYAVGGNLLGAMAGAALAPDPDPTRQDSCAAPPSYESSPSYDSGSSSSYDSGSSCDSSSSYSGGDG